MPLRTPSPSELDELTDVAITAPVTDQILKFNGLDWINGAQVAVSAGPGIIFYLDSTKVIPAGVGPQTFPMETLSKTPTGGVEVSESVTVNNSTGLIDQYLYNTGIGILSIPAGEWTFDTYCYVDNAAGVSEVLISVGRVFIGAGTIAITGIGTTRTATVTAGTPFIASDFNANISLTSYVITPNAVLRITGFTSTSVVTVETLATYTNETGVAYSVDRFLFQDTTGEINNLTVALFSHTVVEPAFATNTTDKLTSRYYGKTDNVGNIVVTFVHNGTEHYTRIHTPLPTLHNDLAGLQGGAANEDYHLTSAEYTGTGTGVFVRQTALPTPSPTVVTETAFGQISDAGISDTHSRGDHTHGTPTAPVIPSASGTVVTETAFGQASTAGAAATFSKGDHTHGTPTAGTMATQNANNVAITGGSVTGADVTATDLKSATTTIAIDGAVAPSAGQVLTASSDTVAAWATPTVVPSASGTVVTETAFGQASNVGVAATFSKGDHTHGTPAAPTIPVASGTVVTETAFGQASNAGAAATFSKGDHTHGTPAAPSIPGAATTVVTETAFGQASTVGIDTTYAREDHTHGTPAAPVIPSASGTVVTETAFGQASNAGAAATFSKGDHTHGTPAAPVTGIINKGVQWIQHGDNVITLAAAQSNTNYIAEVNLKLVAMGGITTRGPYHTFPMTATVYTDLNDANNLTRLKVRLHGGFGFTSCGFIAVVSGVTERFDDVANTQTGRTAVTTARRSSAGFSLNGYGFTSGGDDTVNPLTATERFDDVINAWTVRTGAPAGITQLSGYSINGFGFDSCGYTAGPVVVGNTNRFDDVANAWTGRTAATPRTLLGSFGLNNYGFTSGGTTTRFPAGDTGTTERFDDVANTQTGRTAVTIRELLTGYSLNGFGFTSCGFIGGVTVAGTTERLDDVANTQTGRTAATARYGPAGYSLNGFGFTSGGFIAAVIGTTERFDDIANTHTARTVLNTARFVLSGFSTNEFFVNYITEDA